MGRRHGLQENGAESRGRTPYLPMTAAASSAHRSTAVPESAGQFFAAVDPRPARPPGVLRDRRDRGLKKTGETKAQGLRRTHPAEGARDDPSRNLECKA